MAHREVNLQPMMESLYSVFSTYDCDGNETLDISELMNLMKACNISISRKECEVIIQEMDANSDGMMDFGEFMTFLGMIFKIRFSKRTQLKDEFQRKISQKSESNMIKRKISQNKGEKPAPPPRKGSVIQSSPQTKF